LEQAKTILELVRTSLECLAFIGAGAWAIYTFNALRQFARAKIEIASTEASLRKTEAEVARLAEQARIGALIHFDLSVTTYKVPDYSGLCLNVTLDISNDGIRNAELRYEEDGPLLVYSVAVRPDSTLEYVRVATSYVVSATNPQAKSRRVIVRGGGRQRVDFLVPVPAAGLYLLVFTVPVSAREREINAEFNIKANTRWNARKYVLAT